jgi:hypothetical protein
MGFIAKPLRQLPQKVSAGAPSRSAQDAAGLSPSVARYLYAEPSTPPVIRLFGGRCRRSAVMAKGQARSNKEVRKPKAEKPKPAITVGSSPFTTPPGKK